MCNLLCHWKLNLFVINLIEHSGSKSFIYWTVFVLGPGRGRGRGGPRGRGSRGGPRGGGSRGRGGPSRH